MARFPLAALALLALLTTARAALLVSCLDDAEKDAFVKRCKANARRMSNSYHNTLICFDGELAHLVQLGPENRSGKHKVCITETYISTLLVNCAIQNGEFTV